MSSFPWGDFNDFSSSNGFSHFSDFSTFSIIFTIMFFLVICFFVFIIIKAVSQWHKNNKSPRLTVGAVVITKREDISHHTHHTGNNDMHSSTSTSYYVTFQFESGDRMELDIDGIEYGQLAEGDTGFLTFQGTRYLGFERT